MSALAAFAAALATNTVRVIDPTHMLTPEFPTGTYAVRDRGSVPLRRTRASLVKWNNFSMGEPTSTFRCAGSLDHRPETLP